MKKNKLAIITVAIMLLSPMIGFVAQSANLSNEPLSEDIYNVDKKEYYSTIQLAVDDADPGDTIEVSAGTYVEHIVIPIPLTLIGESKHYTYIMPPANVIAQDWLDDDDTIKIKSSWVNITGFNISNGDDNYASISAYDSSGPAVNNCSIKDNVFFNHYIGIFTFNSNNNIVNHNVFSSGGPCITLYSTNYTLVSNNEMYDNDLGIHV
ncbi:MAG: right-handed parallel beta-helix repeat-containing protein, partial [Gammaproteobacteria bacterium]|nr:right-handed parallel beta-helix repeat-containing protein [Gammaproteobacteria bacterium]